MAMASTVTAAASLRLALHPSPRRPPIPFASLSAVATPPAPRHRCLQEALRRVLRAHPQERKQPLVDEDALPPKPGVYDVYDPTGEL